MKELETCKVKRLYSIDVFRIICAVMVFLFHSKIHIGISYGIFNNFIGYGHIFMVAFFMLSGFSLYYVDNERGKFTEDSLYPGLWNFIIKRFINLYPSYIVLFIIHSFISIFYYKNFNSLEFLVGFPMEVSLLQSVLIGSFDYLHNSGTWFISCIFICYIFYPYVAKIVSRNKLKSNLILFAIFYCISSYAFLPAYKLKFASIYANPLLRFMEFSIGILVAKLFITNRENKIKQYNFYFVLLSYIVLVLSITIVVHFKQTVPCELFNCVAIPCFGSILYFSARLEMYYDFRYFRNTIRILSENTYAFFISQFFAWIPAKYLMASSTFFETYSSIKKLVISIIWSLIVTVFFHYVIERPSKKILSFYCNSKTLN